jgi:hypothetical protein
MAHISIPPGPGTERARMWEMRPEFGEAVRHLSSTVYEKSILTARVAEAVRYAIARINDCPI